MTTQDTTNTTTPETENTEQDLFTKQQSKCEKWLRMVQDSSPLIQFLSRYTNPTVKCTACPPDRLSGFALDNGILMRFLVKRTEKMCEEDEYTRQCPSCRRMIQKIDGLLVLLGKA
jgi:hypothetical protein